MKSIKCFCIAILLLILLPFNVCAGWVLITPMPKGRYGHDAALGPDGNIYVMGGMVFDVTKTGMTDRHDNGMYSNLVYDIQNDKWEFLEPVPGFINTGRYMIFDEENGFWRTVRPAKNKEGYYEGFFPEEDDENEWKMYSDPIPVEKLRKTQIERQGDGVAIVTGRDGLIYWLGGKGKASGSGEEIVLTYDHIKKLWPDVEIKRIYYSSSSYGDKTIYKTQVPAMLERRVDHEAVIASDRIIYVMGGRREIQKKGPRDEMHGTGNQEVSDTVECYNPQTNKWEFKKSMSVKRFAFAAVVGLDDMIYTFGGTDFISENERKTFNLTEVYDPKTDTWTTLKPMPEPRDGAAGVLGADGKIYIIGGASEYKGPPLKSVLVYDPVNDTWEKGPSMNIPRDTFAAVATPDGKIYAIGGTDVGAYEAKQKLNFFLPSKAELYTGKVQDTVEVLDIFE